MGQNIGEIVSFRKKGEVRGIRTPNLAFRFGAPGGIRTPNLDVRTVLLYPLSYRSTKPNRQTHLWRMDTLYNKVRTHFIKNS